jgi:uncharacterized surface protein with fasciclin (FAS1) repeats
MPTIVDIAVSNEAFSTLVTAVSAASLVEALQSPGPFTVFAPTNDAFAKLPDGTITTLVQNIPQLARILTFHVVSGKYKKEDLVGVKSLISLEGTQIDLDVSEESFEANNATVIAADIEADIGAGEEVAAAGGGPEGGIAVPGAIAPGAPAPGGVSPARQVQV